MIDLGPEGGDGGGQIIATGTPEKIARSKKSYTGKYLKPILERDKERTKNESQQPRKNNQNPAYAKHKRGF